MLTFADEVQKQNRDLTEPKKSGCFAWVLYILLFFSMPAILMGIGVMILDTIVPGLVVGILFDIFLFMFFVKYLRRQRGI